VASIIDRTQEKRLKWIEKNKKITFENNLFLHFIYIDLNNYRRNIYSEVRNAFRLPAVLNGLRKIDLISIWERDPLHPQANKLEKILLPIIMINYNIVQQNFYIYYVILHYCNYFLCFILFLVFQYVNSLIDFLDELSHKMYTTKKC